MDRLTIQERIDLSVTDLPDDVVARIMDKLDAASLSSVEWVCKRFRSLVIDHEMWKRLCMCACPQLARAHADISTEDLVRQAARKRKTPPGAKPPRSAVLRSSAFYRLHAELAAPDEQHSLLTDALAASSTDNPEERAVNVLTPLHRFTPALGERSASYWSSKGSDDEGSSEWLLFRLAHPVCLVKKISIRPFLAWFQRGRPIYSAQAVRFVFSCAEPLRDGGTDPTFPANFHAAPPGGQGLQAASEPDQAPSDSSSGGSPAERAETAGFASDETAAFQAVTRLAPMQQQDRPQTFELEEPVLCIGGRLKVELVGRVQRQEQDCMWYTCINHVRVVGKPLYNFVPALGCQPSGADGSPSAGKEAKLVLRMVREDPLVAAGGLIKVSEGGLLEERLRLEEQGIELIDSDDDGDMADLMPLAGFGAPGMFFPFLAPPDDAQEG